MNLQPDPRCGRRSRLPEILLFATVLAFVCASCFAHSADAQPSKPTKTTADRSSPSLAKLQAQAHRLMAKIVEAEAVNNPNQAQIEKLYRKLDDLEQKMWTLDAYPERWTGRGWGRGGGRSWAGPGRGWGRAGTGRNWTGPGWGRGGGRSWARAGGRSWARAGRAWQRAGWGRRSYRGMGRATGAWGRGWGNGPYFLDRDGDGVCDNLDRNWGQQRASTKAGKK